MEKKCFPAVLTNIYTADTRSSIPLLSLRTTDRLKLLSGLTHKGAHCSSDGGEYLTSPESLIQMIIQSKVYINASIKVCLLVTTILPGFPLTQKQLS